MNEVTRLVQTALTLSFACALGSVFSSALAQSNDAELAKKLSNPVAAMISVPFQFNYDQKIGTADAGKRLVMNFQPVIPISLGSDWNLISRTILPVTNQTDIFPGSGHQFGLGDITQ